MTIPFTKMHGLGNDFVLFNNLRQDLALSKKKIRLIADRHLGIGCDQVLLVESANRSDCDFFYRIYNADGSEAAQCGNGARCLARFIHSQGLSEQSRLTLQTQVGRLQTQLEAAGEVTVNMGIPCFDPPQIPLHAELAVRYERILDGQSVCFGAVSVGNPHAVLEVESIDHAPLEALGPLLESYVDFPERTNVGFMQVVSPEHIRLRVFERGVGETQACGSGACAAVAVGHLWRRLQEKVKVELPGGQLMVSWVGPEHPLWLRGPTQHVFQGNIDL